MPADKVLMEEMPSRIKLELYASGYTIIRYKLRPKFMPLNFNV
ncbi:MAG: YbbR-like domain-containing protein, partial [Bacteroidales bacterium]|nr:YbbR-like domain-containing protein [Bacteroidales bacterium]